MRDEHLEAIKRHVRKAGDEISAILGYDLRGPRAEASLPAGDTTPSRRDR